MTLEEAIALRKLFGNLEYAASVEFGFAAYRLATCASRVIECGSGWTTAAIAKAGKPFLSLEEHDFWFKRNTRLVQDMGLSANIVFAPIVNGWYSTESIDGTFDLVVCDGPRAVPDDAREPVLARLMDHLAEKAIILLDDTHRPAEREALDRWKQAVRQSSVEFKPGTHGNNCEFAVFSFEK